MVDPKLSIIGTSHRDMMGKQRLAHIFDKIKPTIACVEFDPELIKILPDARLPMDPAKTIDSILRQVPMFLDDDTRAKLISNYNFWHMLEGYEIRFVQEYVAKNKDCRIEYVDTGMGRHKDLLFGKLQEFFSRPMIEDLRDLETRKMYLDNLKRSDAEFFRDGMKSTIGSYLDYEKKITAPAKEEFSAKYYQSRGYSDEEIEIFRALLGPQRNEEIEKNIRKLYDGKENIALVIGLGHVSGLYKRLWEFNPRIMTLHQYNKV